MRSCSIGTIPPYGRSWQRRAAYARHKGTDRPVRLVRQSAKRCHVASWLASQYALLLLLLDAHPRPSAASLIAMAACKAIGPPMPTRQPGIAHFALNAVSLPTSGLDMDCRQAPIAVVARADCRVAQAGPSRQQGLPSITRGDLPHALHSSTWRIEEGVAGAFTLNPSHAPVPATQSHRHSPGCRRLRWAQCHLGRKRPNARARLKRIHIVCWRRKSLGRSCRHKYPCWLCWCLLSSRTKS